MGSMACGFSTKTCLPAVDRRQGVERMEFRRVSDDHDVGDFDDMLIGVEAGEAVLVGDLHLVGELELHRGAVLLNTVEQHVRHGDDVHVLAGAHGVQRGVGAAIAAADDADLDHVAAGDVGRGGHGG